MAFSGKSKESADRSVWVIQRRESADQWKSSGTNGGVQESSSSAVTEISGRIGLAEGLGSIEADKGVEERFRIVSVLNFRTVLDTKNILLWWWLRNRTFVSDE